MLKVGFWLLVDFFNVSLSFSASGFPYDSAPPRFSIHVLPFQAVNGSYLLLFDAYQPGSGAQRDNLGGLGSALVLDQPRAPGSLGWAS